MGIYVLRRLLSLVPMLLGVSIILFGVIQIAPGGPEMFYIGEEIPDPLQVEAIRRNLGLDAPVHIQYFRWLSSISRGNLGISFISYRPVIEHITERLAATVLLTTSGLLFAVIAGIPLGVLSAVLRYSLIDKIVTFVAFIGISFPAFWLGIMLVLVFSVFLGWLPVSGMSSYGREADILDRLRYLVLPMITLGTVQMATFMRYTRSSILDVLNEDYVRTARAKGLAEKVVLFRHALRNSLIPIVTILGLRLRDIVAGAALTETVFAWPGIGRMAVEAVFARDYPLIMGINIIIAVLVILGNLLVDVTYAWIDPRITYG